MSSSWVKRPFVFIFNWIVLLSIPIWGGTVLLVMTIYEGVTESPHPTTDILLGKQIVLFKS